ncbi:MAG TPA: efflux RND transporter periplasmic adaptor subunit [Thermoanaerobaculia bacterium]
MKRILFIFLGIALVFVTVVQLRAMRPARSAATQKQLPAAKTISAEGRLVAYPGAEVIVGSDVAGTIERLTVEEKQSVRRGDVLAVIRADDTRAALAQAKARVNEADADIRLFELERDRARSLWQTEVGSKQTWERAERDLDAARARRASAIADVRRLDAVVQKTVIKAPIDGVVITRFAQPGETIVSGDHIMTIADLARTRIEAEVDEFDAAHLSLGSHAVVSAEGYKDRWQGRVEEIPDSVTNRRLKPQDTSKPVDTRVLLVKVAMHDRTPLKLGQRVEIEIESQ